MVCKLECDCDERIGIKVDSYKLFEELKNFFEGQVEKGIFEDIPVKNPFYIWSNDENPKKICAKMMYKCNACGCLWEFRYPEFPALGFVKKFEDGKYISNWEGK